MNTTVRVFTFLLGVIGLATGGASVLSGLADATPALDNTFRFQAGIWMAVGLGLLHSAVAYEKSEQLFRFLMQALIVGGLARAVGLLDYAPERAVVAPIIIELVVPTLLLVLRAKASKNNTVATTTNGKRVLVTGANGGLGKETVGALVEDGYDAVVMATRTNAKGVAARDALTERHPGAPTKLEVASGFDMTDPAKIEAAVEALDASKPFDVVFLQAGGGVFTDEVQTVTHRGQSIERTAFQNVFGAHVVLSNLIRRGLVAPGARVVFAGGEGARGIPGLIAKPEFGSPLDLRRYLHGKSAEAYNAMNALGASKFVGALWVGRLARLANRSFDAVWFSPGLTRGTQGLSSAPAFRRFMAERIGFPIMGLLGLAQSPADGGRKYADALGGLGGNGDVLGAPEGKALGAIVDQRPMNPQMSDPALQDELWSLFEALGGSFGEARDAASKAS